MNLQYGEDSCAFHSSPHNFLRFSLFLVCTLSLKPTITIQKLDSKSSWVYHNSFSNSQ